MQPWITRGLVLLTGVAIATAALTALSPKRTATVVFVNAADLVVEEIRLNAPSGAVHFVRNLVPGAEVAVRVSVPGEGSYSFRVRFADGHELVQHDVYVESGYRLRHHIHEESTDWALDALPYACVPTQPDNAFELTITT